MGVYIDMEMPKEGFVEILIRDDGTVQQTGQSYRIDGTDYYTPYVSEMPKMFTAVPVPPHGDLIDRDALMHEFEKAERTMEQHGREYSCSFLSSSQEISTEWYCVEDILEAAPAVIPADTAEEGET